MALRGKSLQRETLIRRLSSRTKSSRHGPNDDKHPLRRFSASAFGGSCHQQILFSGVPGKRGGALELGARFIEAAHFREEIPAYGRQQMVRPQRRLVGKRFD
jgi:hypothetical protein